LNDQLSVDQIWEAVRWNQPDETAIWFAYTGDILFENGNIEDAKQAYKRSFEINDREYRATIGLAESNTKAGCIDEALYWSEISVKIVEEDRKDDLELTASCLTKTSALAISAGQSEKGLLYGEKAVLAQPGDDLILRDYIHSCSPEKVISLMDGPLTEAYSDLANYKAEDGPHQNLISRVGDLIFTSLDFGYYNIEAFWFGLMEACRITGRYDVFGKICQKAIDSLDRQIRYFKGSLPYHDEWRIRLHFKRAHFIIQVTQDLDEAIALLTPIAVKETTLGPYYQVMSCMKYVASAHCIQIHFQKIIADSTLPTIDQTRTHEVQNLLDINNSTRYEYSDVRSWSPLLLDKLKQMRKEPNDLMDNARICVKDFIDRIGDKIGPEDDYDFQLPYILFNLAITLLLIDDEENGATALVLSDCHMAKEPEYLNLDEDDYECAGLCGRIKIYREKPVEEPTNLVYKKCGVTSEYWLCLFCFNSTICTDHFIFRQRSPRMGLRFCPECYVLLQDGKLPYKNCDENHPLHHRMPAAIKHAIDDDVIVDLEVSGQDIHVDSWWDALKTKYT